MFWYVLAANWKRTLKLLSQLFYCSLWCSLNYTKVFLEKVILLRCISLELQLLSLVGCCWGGGGGGGTAVTVIDPWVCHKKDVDIMQQFGLRLHSIGLSSVPVIGFPGY